jgi:hypothetical protein
MLIHQGAGGFVLLLTACSEVMDSKYKISVYGFGFAGSADYSELQKALGDYLPLLLGLTFTGNVCVYTRMCVCVCVCVCVAPRPQNSQFLQIL